MAAGRPAGLTVEGFGARQGQLLEISELLLPKAGRSGLKGLAMGATGPTTWSALSFDKLGACSLDMMFSSFRLLDGNNPADPFIARKWRKIIPHCQHIWGNRKGI
ncbi:MAG TPA: hypothetical protein VN642_07715 [Dongiaceae bacterium]|nr:hypothetical protein [Dongiaceae bacterium]